MNETQTAINQVQDGTRNFFTDCHDYALNWLGTKDFFTSEDLRHDFEASHDFKPAEPKVWGAVIRKLKKDGFIAHAGFGTYKNPIGHSKPTNQWMPI